jgi:hypothetical protein
MRADTNGRVPFMLTLGQTAPQELWHCLEAHLRDTAEKARQFVRRNRI